MKTAVALVCALVIAIPAAADPRLLVEFSWGDGVAVSPGTDYGFSVRPRGGLPQVNWLLENVTDLNQMITADAATLEAFEVALTNAGIIPSVFLPRGGQCGSFLQCTDGMAFSRFFEAPIGEWVQSDINQIGWHARPHVRQLGSGLQGYDLTGIERDLSPSSQAIRIYGEEQRVPGAATPILLAEIKWNFGYTMAGPNAGLTFLARERPGSEAGEISGSYTTADVGKTFRADAENLGKMQRAFTSSQGSLDLAVDAAVPIDSVALEVADFWDWPPRADALPQWTVFVPQRGVGLSGYSLTDVTQTINRLDFSIVCSDQCRPHTSVETTIRVYGGTIPEPTTWALLAIAVSIWLLRRRN